MSDLLAAEWREAARFYGWRWREDVPHEELPFYFQPFGADDWDDVPLAEQEAMRRMERLLMRTLRECLPSREDDGR